MSIFIVRPPPTRETGYAGFNNGTKWQEEKNIPAIINNYFTEFTSNGIAPTYIFCNKAEGLEKTLVFQEEDVPETRAEIIKNFFSTPDGDKVATLLSTVNIEENSVKKNGAPMTLIDSQIMYGLRRFNDKKVKDAFTDTFDFFGINTPDINIQKLKYSECLPFEWAINMHKHNVLSDCALFYVLFCSKRAEGKQKSIIAFDYIRENGLQGSSTKEFGYKQFIKNDEFKGKTGGVNQNFKLYVLFLKYTIEHLKETPKNAKPQELPVNMYWKEQDPIKFSLSLLGPATNTAANEIHNESIASGEIDTRNILIYPSNELTEMNNELFQEVENFKVDAKTPIKKKKKKSANVAIVEKSPLVPIEEIADYFHNESQQVNVPVDTELPGVPKTPVNFELDDFPSVENSPLNDVERDGYINDFEKDRDKVFYPDTPMRIIFEGYQKELFNEEKVFELIVREQLNDADMFDELITVIPIGFDLGFLKKKCAVILRFLQKELVSFSEQIKDEIIAVMVQVQLSASIDDIKTLTENYVKGATLKYYFAQLLKKKNDDMVLNQFQKYLLQNSGRKIGDKYLFIYFIFHASFEKWCSKEIIDSIFSEHIKKLSVLEAAEFIVQLFDEYVIKKGQVYYFSADFVLFSIQGICFRFVDPAQFKLFRENKIETAALFAMYSFYDPQKFLRLITRFLQNTAPVEVYLWYSGIIKSKDEYDWTEIAKFIPKSQSLLSNPRVLIRFIEEYIARNIALANVNQKELTEEIAQTFNDDNANNMFFLVLKDLFKKNIIMNQEFVYFVNNQIWRAVQRVCEKQTLPYKTLILSTLEQKNKDIDFGDIKKTEVLYNLYIALFKAETPKEIVYKKYKEVLESLEKKPEIPVDSVFLKNYAVIKQTNTEDDARFYFIYVNQQRGNISPQYTFVEEQNGTKVWDFIRWVISSPIDTYLKIFCIEQSLRFFLDKKKWERVKNVNALGNFLDDVELLNDKTHLSSFGEFFDDLVGKKRTTGARDNKALFSAFFSRLSM